LFGKVTFIAFICVSLLQFIIPWCCIIWNVHFTYVHIHIVREYDIHNKYLLKLRL